MVNNNQLEVVKLLTSRGANPNALNKSGSPLLCAFHKGYGEIVQVLLVAGADIPSKYKNII